MRKQALPPRARKQAVASLLNMPLVDPTEQGRQVRASQRSGLIATHGRRGLSLCRGVAHHPYEGQQHRLLLGGGRVVLAQLLCLALPAQLLKLELCPQLAEARATRVAEQRRSQGRSSLVAASG